MAAVVGVGAVCASPVAAATTIGQTSDTGVEPCADSGGFVQASTGASGPAYTVPADGVLTSWSTQTSAVPNQSLKLKVLHLQSGTTYTVVGESGFEPLTAGALNTFPARIAVHAGDVLGLKTAASTSDGCIFDSSDASDASSYDSMGPDGPPGTTMDFGPPAGNRRLNISAVIEPDADGDGFGDETQDRCPTDASTQGLCVVDLSVTDTPSKTVVNLGENVLYTISAKNNSGENPAKSVSVSDALPAGMALVSASGGTCSGTTCNVATIGPGATATVTVVARATAAGAQTNTATASSNQLADPNTPNNTASATTNVLAPPPPLAFGGLTFGSVTEIVGSNGKVKIPLSCPATSQGNCAGADTLQTAGKVTLNAAPATKKAKILTLGKTTFSIPAGTTKTITIKLSHNALNLLEKKRKLKAKQTIVSHDNRNLPKTTTGTLTLKVTTAKKR